MAGTKVGGKKAAATNKRKFGDNFYAEIGAKGGRNGHTGGFAANPVLARIAGRKGGTISRRGPSAKKVLENGKLVTKINVRKYSSHNRKVRVNNGND